MHQKHEEVLVVPSAGAWVLLAWWVGGTRKPLLARRPRPPREEEEEEEETQTRGQWECGGNLSALPWVKSSSPAQEVLSSAAAL